MAQQQHARARGESERIVYSRRHTKTGRQRYEFAPPIFGNEDQGVDIACGSRATEQRSGHAANHHPWNFRGLEPASELDQYVYELSWNRVRHEAIELDASTAHERRRPPIRAPAAEDADTRLASSSTSVGICFRWTYAAALQFRTDWQATTLPCDAQYLVRKPTTWPQYSRLATRIRARTFRLYASKIPCNTPSLQRPARPRSPNGAGHDAARRAIAKEIEEQCAAGAGGRSAIVPFHADGGWP